MPQRIVSSDEPGDADALDKDVEKTSGNNEQTDASIPRHADQPPAPRKKVYQEGWRLHLLTLGYVAPPWKPNH